MESWYGAKADTKKKYNNQSLEPIAASWAAPAQLLVGVKQKASNMNTKTDEKDTRTTPLISIQRKRPMVSGAKVGLVVLCLWLAFFGFVIFALNSPFRSLEAMIMDIPDVIEERDEPLVIIFFAPPDVLSGLFTLANYDEREPDNVIAPFGAGCGTIVHHPCRELTSDRPRAVMGMFDVSARPCVPPNVLSFAVPWPKFVRMVDNMEESFLITKSWGKVKKRIKT